MINEIGMAEQRRNDQTLGSAIGSNDRRSNKRKTNNKTNNVRLEMTAKRGGQIVERVDYSVPPPLER